MLNTEIVSVNNTVGVLFNEDLTNAKQFFSVEEYTNVTYGMEQFEAYQRIKQFNTYKEVIEFINSNDCEGGKIYGVWSSLYLYTHGTPNEISRTLYPVNVFYKKLQ